MVFRGREGTFCSGFDLDELQSDFIGTTGAFEIAQRSARILDAIFNSPKPSVCVSWTPYASQSSRSLRETVATVPLRAAAGSR